MRRKETDLRRRRLGRDRAQQIHGGILGCPIGRRILPILLQARPNPGPHDLRRFGTIAAPDEGLQHVRCGLPACTRLATDTSAGPRAGWKSEIKTDEFEGVVFELLNIVCAEGDVGYDDALDER